MTAPHSPEQEQTRVCPGCGGTNNHHHTNCHGTGRITSEPFLETAPPEQEDGAVSKFKDLPMPDATEEMRGSVEFEAIWQCIKSWDVNVPEYYDGYCGANGSHVALILAALEAVWKQQRLNLETALAQAQAERDDYKARLQTLIDAATTRDLSGHPELKAALQAEGETDG